MIIFTIKAAASQRLFAPIFMIFVLVFVVAFYLNKIKIVSLAN